MLPFRPVRAFAVMLLAALAGALLPVTAAHAESRTVQGGRLDWGIKASFQSYITGPIANGSWRLTGGAATVGGSQFRFHSATGSYDPGTGAFRSGFSGGVHFTGHKKPDGTHQLDLSISRPTVRISGGRGTVHVDMVSKAKGTGKLTTYNQVAFADLDLSGIDMRGGGSPVSLAGVPATLTAQGATAFAGYYTAGTPLDPVSLSVDVAAATRTPSATPSASASADAGGKDGKDAKKGPGAFRDAAVDWGVRRTFREYVTGSIAQGKWTLADGAEDGGALFRFPRGKGSYDPEKQTLDADFAGSVRFTGKDLDLTLGKVSVRVEKGKGTLSADVTSGGATTKAVPLITFVAGDFAPKGGLARLTEAPATLTEGGSTAFNSLYRAGTEMDPISLAVAVDAKAHLPALPDLGSEPTASASPTADKPSADPTGQTDAAAPSGTSSLAGTYTAAGAALLVIAAAAVYVALRRRRANTAGSPPASDGPDPAVAAGDEN
ncbi:HtaA domain-containing protein [Streptomyces sp. FIT100]|uniref:HtaA domain-containing protein n=1 Tax=Streptomyces sp. FIT100 TaxID=2837956 RepID=UPI0021C9D9CA|nr:HtaA domain-containing protein [Streptomyces sp. FIT100]UUN26572.1 HtaA domain-containing protein [Streptomyces sp. FIT100]